MRETRKSMSHFIRKCGITPAYAGNTYTFLHDLHKAEDHPRVCGKHLNERIFQNFKLRITPAYAGNTNLLLELCDLV